jgi:hypothetical protein
MNKSETIAELAKALCKAQGDFGPLIKGATNPFFKSRYSDLASVIDVARAPLLENGLSFCQLTEKSEDGTIVVETVLLHTSGEWIAGTLRMALVKNDPQGYGSAFTYCRRYALQAILGLAAEDDDAESAAARKKEPEKEADKKSPPPEPVKPPAPEPLTVRGVIEEVSTKEGEKNGKPWKRYGARIGEAWYGTFSRTIGDAAESCKGAEVVISYTGGERNTIVELVPVAV